MEIKHVYILVASLFLISAIAQFYTFYHNFNYSDAGMKVGTLAGIGINLVFSAGAYYLSRQQAKAGEVDMEELNNVMKKFNGIQTTDERDT